MTNRSELTTAATVAARGVTRHRGSAVVLDGVTVTVGPQSRIGVVGPNGVGKTTLLRIMAGLETPDDGRVDRLPAWATVGYLPQEPDRRPGETLAAYLARRTGVTDATELLERSAAALAGASSEPAVAAALGLPEQADPSEVYAVALERYLALGGPDLESHAEEVCADLGLDESRLQVEMSGLSGGQAARASLAGVLLSRFDVLLLDEPTNDLDFAGLDRLEAFLRGIGGGVVIVSHDRAFLERTIDSVLEIDEHTRKATEYRGGWLAYLEDRTTARRHQMEAYENYRSQRSTLLERAREQRQWGVVGVNREKKHPRDNDKAQRDFRINRTQKMMSKIRITEVALDRLEREAIAKPFESWDLRLQLPVAPHASEVVAWARGAVAERGSWRLGPVDVEIRAGERVGLVGPNGCGKTTLLGMLLGRVPLVAGDAGLGPSTVVGELDQARALLEAGSEGEDEEDGEGGTLVQAFAAAAGLLQREARSLLAKFGLTASHVERPTTTLSPGERTRAELALLMARQTNCLVLDEPTNHLDLPAIEELEEALEGYDGTLILVTHDRRLLEAVELSRSIDVTAL